MGWYPGITTKIRASTNRTGILEIQIEWEWDEYRDSYWKKSWVYAVAWKVMNRETRILKMIGEIEFENKRIWKWKERKVNRGG